MTKGLLRFRTVVLILFFLSNVIINDDNTAQAQRSLHHWKRDLEHRLRQYQEQQGAIQSIVSSSIYPTTSGNGGDRPPVFNGPVRIASTGNVRFSDLIIPAGSLRLSDHVAPSTVRILVDKTQAYMNSKSSDLFQIQSQMETIQRQLDDPMNQYIYKGVRGAPQPPHNTTTIITGTRVFKQAQFVNLIESQNVTLKRINFTDVSRVIDDTYLRNLKFGVFDSQGRLFLEGRKTLWDTVFSRSLQSGCCDRLRPLHTSRMMLRLAPQDVQAPILIHARDSTPHYNQACHIGALSTGRLYNRAISLDTRPTGETGLLPAAMPENFIQLASLINTRQLDQPQILKTLVFKNAVSMDEALLANSYADNRLVIGVASAPNFAFDLSHENYLLRYANVPRNYSRPVQTLPGTLVVEGQASFLGGVDAQTVNRIGQFSQFVHESLVNIQQPTTIRGPIQFNALPAMLSHHHQYNGIGPSSSSSSMAHQNVQILRAHGNLDVGTLNGMRLPGDLVLLPTAQRLNERLVLRPGQEVRVRGSRHFATRATFDFLQVNGLVNGLALPGGVIPLHLNDFMDSVGHSNLRFLDGITVSHMTVQSQQFDEINLRDVNGDAQSIVMRSMSLGQPDGSLLIRAPLRVLKLNLIGTSGSGRGLLNGFRPQEVLELQLQQGGEPGRLAQTSSQSSAYETLYGRKRFAAHVEVTDCIFNDINQVANWTNHLIRIDRPHTVQTVHTRLAFHTAATPPLGLIVVNQSQLISPPAGVNIDKLQVDFQPDSERANHEANWNFSPELYLLHQALARNVANYTGGRYRVDQVRLMGGSGAAVATGGLVNRIPLSDIVTLDRPFRFADRFTMVGKVEVRDTLRADRIHSNYPIDAMDLVQFNKHRIPIVGDTRAPIRLPSLVLGPDNRASFVQCRLLNGVPFSEFARTIMSLTQPQEVHSSLVFQGPVSLEGMARTRSSLNGVKDFGQFARALKNAKYSFEEGLQCNSVVVRT